MATTTHVRPRTLTTRLRSLARGSLLGALALPCLALAGAGIRAADQGAGATHPFDVHDLWAMDRVSEPQASPDGRLVVFQLRVTDLAANKGRTDLWLVGIDGTGLRRLTSHEANDTNARWSPDGSTIYFLSTRSGSSQVWRINLGGGEAEQVTHLPQGAGSMAVSPDGKLLAVSMDVFVDCPTLDCTGKRLDEAAARKSSGRIYDRLFFRHWDTWSDGRRSHVFVVAAAGGDPVDVMKGMDADCPSKPFGGPEEYTFTPDSRGIVFTARDAGRVEAWSTDLDLYLAPADSSAVPVCLTTSNEGTDTSPLFSPDGRTLAYLSMARAGYEADRLRIMLMPWSPARAGGGAGTGPGAALELAPAWDRSPSSIVWSLDGKTLFADADDLGQHALFAIDVPRGSVRTIVPQGDAHGPTVAGQGGKLRLVVALDDLKAPAELYTVKADGSELKPITHINAPKLAAVRMGDHEQFSFKGANDDLVYAHVVRPVDFQEGKKYPVAFLIHGGPQGSFSNQFHYRWNGEIYAGAGYAAIMVDFHGSTGYGQAFCDAIGDDWGGKPLVDLQKGLDAALAHYPWMDGDRVAALGASYGAYMINWIEGNWPGRFRCLVSHDGNLDERAAYYQTEELWFPEWDHKGTPWTNPKGYEKHNPQNFVQNWKTPILVIHGGQDFRVVETSGMATFTAAQRMGIPSKFLYFPDENHWVLKPQNGILWHDTVLGWLDQWTKSPPTKPSR